MGRETREWHPNFLEYMTSISNHPNYSGMPEILKSDGSLRWVVTGKSRVGRLRSGWWREKANDLGIPIIGKWISETAKKNHPTKIKVCQVCGRSMSIEYTYPNKNLIKKFNKIIWIKNEFDYFDFFTIKEIIHEIISDSKTIEGYGELSKIFSIPKSVKKTEDNYWKYVYDNFVKIESRLLSPGAMSNAPDGFDGFHTYNICCRAVQDTGRHPENLSRYIEDRRAYEHWSDGDWKAASWLMQKAYGICPVCGIEGEITADHIGPISLGFCQGRPETVLNSAG